MVLRKIGILVLLMLVGIGLQAQSFSQGDSLTMACAFEDALRAYMSVPRAGMSQEAEDSLERRISTAQFACGMTDFCATPHVVARKGFSREDFFLYYPLKQKAWRKGQFPVYAPNGALEIYFSAQDKAGTSCIWYTRDLDSLWQSPRLLGEAFLSSGDEVFPMLSKDGKTLWFASNGLSGMGGFDIFASTWDQENGCWGTPVNVGFPFNSPADDYLMADSDDGKYTLFASNRACGADSVYVYVIEREASPARKAINEPSALRALLELKPVEDPTRIDNAAAVNGFSTGNAVTQRYMKKMEESRALMDSISRHMTPGDTLLPFFRSRLALVSAELREVEMSFLMSGAVAFEEDREVVGADLGYTFAKGSFGPPLRVSLAIPESTPSYRIAPVGRFAQDNTLPPGLVFQIFLFDSPTHAVLEDIHGLTPVYERLGLNLRYSYYAGLFPSYQDALAQLNVIRRLGFPQARIVAWQDGKQVAI